MRSIFLLLLGILSVPFFKCKVNAQLVSIKGGTFLMGSENGKPDEKPKHKVSLSPYKMDKHEVTESQYDSCVRAGKCTPAHYSDGKCLAWTMGGFHNVNVPGARRNPDFPVVCVTWSQAQVYCQIHGEHLPTEAQWEYSASAGRSVKYSWGDQPPSSAHCAGSKNQRPDKVCSHGVNPYGLADMTGNVWEWTSDYYSKDYYSVSPVQDPTGPDVGLYRVIRGGGWYSNAEQLRVTNRNWFSPNFAEVSIGFRCVSR